MKTAVLHSDIAVAAVRGGIQADAQETSPPTEDEGSIEWPEVSRSGQIVKTSIPNVRAFLDYLGLKLWLNQFENRIRIDGSDEVSGSGSASAVMALVKPMN